MQLNFVFLDFMIESPAFDERMFALSHCCIPGSMRQEREASCSARSQQKMPVFQKNSLWSIVSEKALKLDSFRAFYYIK